MDLVLNTGKIQGLQNSCIHTVSIKSMTKEGVPEPIRMEWDREFECAHLTWGICSQMN